MSSQCVSLSVKLNVDSYKTEGGLIWKAVPLVYLELTFCFYKFTAFQMIKRKCSFIFDFNAASKSDPLNLNAPHTVLIMVHFTV